MRFNYRSVIRQMSFLFVLTATASVSAEDETKPQPVAIDAQQLSRTARSSLVAISVQGRDGKRQGLGTGFVVSADGLIATNLHVIGEARPIRVQFSDGKDLAVTAIHASDRSLDLALLRIDAQELPPLALGDSSSLEQGQPIVALGNPLGLKYSVVSGVISGQREYEGREMIQLALPVEPGNSGGPVLNGAGEAVGIVTMKSLVTENLGFAVKINDLKQLIARPNPVPMERWLTIGAIDRKRWTPLFGARWQQRAGRIIAGGSGSGFGGRSLCINNQQPPELPYEVGVAVRMDDESGAAGLVFHSDGGDRHYGFYPTSGKLRLTRFEGPNVFTWKVLSDIDTPHYRRGEWNYLKVRVEKDKIRCFLNDQLVIESDDDGLGMGKLGLAKFRHTEAQFKQFRVAKELPPSQLSKKVSDGLRREVEKLKGLEKTLPEDIAPLLTDARASVEVMRQQAKELRRRADELSRLASDVHTAGVVARLKAELQQDEKDVSLLGAALLVARLDDDEVHVASYQSQVDQWAEEIKESVGANADAAERLAALNKYLFETNGFHGSRTDYYHRANSYLNRVIDDREGLPITLSVLYIELGRRLGLNLVGVGLPGHFVVRHEPKEGKPQLIDAFNRGAVMTRDDAGKVVLEITGEAVKEEHFSAYSKKDIVQRMLYNLLGIAQRADDKEAVLRYLEALVVLDDSDLQSRGMRAIFRFQTGRRAASLADLDWFLDRRPEGIDLEELRKMREHFQTAPTPQK